MPRRRSPATFWTTPGNPGDGYASDEHDPSKEDEMIIVRYAPVDPATDTDGGFEDDHIVRGLE